MRSVWSRLSSKEVLGEDCAGDSWPGQWSQLWLGWGRGLSRLSQSQRQSPDTLTARKSSEDLQPTRLDWCSGVCPDHLFGRTQANQELLRSLSPKWGSVESLCFEPPGACLGRPFSAFSFSAGPRERQKLAETRNWRLLGGAVALQITCLGTKRQGKHC